LERTGLSNRSSSGESIEGAALIDEEVDRAAELGLNMEGKEEVEMIGGLISHRSWHAFHSIGCMALVQPILLRSRRSRYYFRLLRRSHAAALRDVPPGSIR